MVMQFWFLPFLGGLFQTRRVNKYYILSYTKVTWESLFWKSRLLVVKVSYFGDKDSRQHPTFASWMFSLLASFPRPSHRGCTEWPFKSASPSAKGPYEGTFATCWGGVFIHQVFREGCSCVSTAMTNRLEIRVLAWPARWQNKTNLSSWVRKYQISALGCTRS